MIIITGASRGIGKYLAEKFNMDNYEVLGTYNSTELNKSELLFDYCKVDVSNYDSVFMFVEANKFRLNDIVLINCAGISYNSYIHKSDVELWHKVIDVNLKGTYNLIRAVLPLMRQQKYGRVINFASVVTKLPTPGISAYMAAKTGINGLTKSIAIENGALGITANALNLGYANIGMGLESVPEEYQSKIISQIPAGRFCEPFEIYDTVRFIINNNYLNGSIIDLNGGLI